MNFLDAYKHGLVMYSDILLELRKHMSVITH